MAAGRYTSQLTVITFLSACSMSRRASFATVVVLPEHLEPGDQHHRRRLHVEDEPCAAPAHQLGQLVADHPDQRLTRGEAREDVLAHRALAYPLDELAHHRQRDICLQHRGADLAQRLADVVVGPGARGRAGDSGPCRAGW